MRRSPLALAVAVTACATAPRPTPPRPTAPVPDAAIASPRYHATIRWTDHGVPHIVAADLGGLGFGQGYAQAQARLCELADGIVRVRGERARYLGPGVDDANVKSDLAYRHLGYHARAEAALATASADSQAMIAGFAAGYSHALATMPVAQQPEACRGAAWLGPITAADVAGYGLSLQSLASARFLLAAIADATPGGSGNGSATPTSAPGASNAWAIGADRTASGGGILIGNPHFPWQGDLTFHEAHLTIPGALDVYGVALIGTPGIQIGTTPHHAWTHTFSASTHMVVYRVALGARSAVRYRHGDDERAMRPSQYTIAVRRPDGTLEDRAFTRYRTAFGPMIATAIAPWDGPGGFGFTVADVADGGGLALDEYLALARATTRAEFERALALHATPFVNTIYADATGDALYVDGSRVPALSPAALATWKLMRKLAPPIEAAWRQRLVILDGSSPENQLATDDPRAPGAIGFAQVPRVLRRDFVMNANDSFRFTNLAAPETLAELSPLWGDDADRPSMRTLANLAALAPGSTAAGADDRFTLDEAIGSMLGNASFTAARLRDDVLAACPPPPRRPPSKLAPLAAGCAALAAWDGRFGVDSRGALLWRELVNGLATDDVLPWARPFDRQAPRLTPDGLAVGTEAIQAALVAAVDRLRGAALTPDAALGVAQRATSRDGAAPVPGGTDLDGVTNINTWNRFDATALSYADAPVRYPVNFGASFVLAVELTPAGRTVRALLSYGNASDPASPWYRDQLAALGRAELRTVPLTDAEIAADPAFRLEEIASP